MDGITKLIIAGSRDFNDYFLLKTKLTSILQNTTNVEIVSGGCRGADKLGENFAEEMGYSVVTFPADWNKYGKQAGYVRNKQMAEYATHCVCFWDGVSKGTKLMIELARKCKLKLRIVKYDKNKYKQTEKYEI